LVWEAAPSQLPKTLPLRRARNKKGKRQNGRMGGKYIGPRAREFTFIIFLYSLSIFFIPSSHFRKKREKERYKEVVFLGLLKTKKWEGDKKHAPVTLP
jgi:hypothetical protein